MKPWVLLLGLVVGAWCQDGVDASSYYSYCPYPVWSSIPATNVQYLQYFKNYPPPCLDAFFEPYFPAASNGFKYGAFPFGHYVTCPGLPQPVTDWALGSESNPSHLLVRFDVFVPSLFLDSTLTITVDNDLLGAWVNGHSVLTAPKVRDDCGPVSKPIYIDIPKGYLYPGHNVIALHVKDRGVQSFLDASVKIKVCYDQCTVAAAKCRFEFKYHEGTVPVFALGNTPDGPGFTTQIISKDPSLTINDMNANIKPQFIDPITGTRTNVDVFGLTPFQFKPFNQPVPRIGFETFQGNTRSQANNRCVIINFTNWRTTFPNGNIVNVNINSPYDCPNNDCCVVFRTTNPA